jgi:HAD superfamily hydrolase (TIGR01509 family)
MRNKNFRDGRVENVIFDLDGTLTQFNLPFDRIREVLEIRERFVLESILKSPLEERKRKFEILKKFEIESAKNSKLNEGVKELMVFLDNSGIKKGIVTRNCRESAEIFAEKFKRKFRIEFDYIISRESTLPKPSPLPMILALVKSKSTPDTSITVGDFKFDLISGKLAGIRTVLLETEKNKDIIHEFYDLSDIRIKNLRELIPYIKSANSEKK